jgi:hypothetical protein
MAANRKPWPMGWILLAMILFIAPYTYLTIHFRKPGPGYQPYEDAREKTRIAHAGFKRVTLRAVRPADVRAVANGSALPAPGGLPADLTASLLEKPLLPASIGAVAAAPDAAAGDSYQIQFSCTLSDIGQQLSGGQYYVRGSDVYVIVDFERLETGLAARSRQNVIELAAPPGSFDPGTYHVTLVGQTASKSWTLQVH